MTSVREGSTEVKRNVHGRFLTGTAQPARRGRGGQSGNLNASKSPWRAFWQRRALRPEDRWILPLLADYAGSLVSDRGGPEAMTAGEAHMIELAQLARGCTMLVLAQAATSGGIVAGRRSASIKGGNVLRRISDPDLVNALAKFMRIESGALQAIGMERRAKPAMSLTQYLSGRSTPAGRVGASTTAQEPIDVEPVDPEGERR